MIAWAGYRQSAKRRTGGMNATIPDAANPGVPAERGLQPLVCHKSGVCLGPTGYNWLSLSVDTCRSSFEEQIQCENNKNKKNIALKKNTRKSGKYTQHTRTQTRRVLTNVSSDMQIHAKYTQHNTRNMHALIFYFFWFTVA